MQNELRLFALCHWSCEQQGLKILWLCFFGHYDLEYVKSKLANTPVGKIV